MNIIQKAQINANLTPGERALLKTLQSLLLTAITAGLLAAGGYIMAPGMIDTQRLIDIVIAAIVLSLAHGVAKYVTAQGDAPLGTAIEEVTQAVEKRLPQVLQPTAMPRVRNPSSMDTIPNMPIVQPPQRPPTQQL
ncbi:MAG: hypothetical protein PVSMB2_31150 [Ktedonobacteraceae bacterium]